MAETHHNLRLQIAKEQARSREEGALTCKKQTDPKNFVKYSHDENCLINARRRRILTIRNPFASSALLCTIEGNGTVRGRGGSMGRHVIVRLRGPREGPERPDGHVPEPSLSRVPILGFWRVLYNYKYIQRPLWGLLLP